MSDEIFLFEKQIQFYNLTDREALLEAGISYGKSRVASIWLANQVQEYKKSKWFMAARDYRQLKTAIDEEFEFYMHDILCMRRGKHYRKTSGSPILYEFKNGSKIFGVGAHNYDTVFRAGNYNGAWADEVDYWKPDAVKALRGRIRVFPELLRFTSSPLGYNHVWEDFYQNNAGPIINATTLENPTLSPEYIESLRKTYSPRLFEQEVLAKRLNLNVGAVYNEFNRDIHVRGCKDEYRRGEDQLYFFLDYNIAHYCGCYMFERDGVVYTIGEEHLQFKYTEDMAKQVKSKYPEAIVIGDSAGNTKRDVSSTRVNYQIFKDHGLMTKRHRNPPVQSRIISANSNLHHRKHIIDIGCQNLIRDLELVSWKDDGKDVDKSDISLSHASDAWSYGDHYLIPVTGKPKGARVILS